MDMGWLVVGVVVLLVAMAVIVNLAYAIDGEPEGGGDRTVLHSDELTDELQDRMERVQQDELDYRLTEDAHLAAEAHQQAVDDHALVYHHYDDHYGTSPFDR